MHVVISQGDAIRYGRSFPLALIEELGPSQCWRSDGMSTSIEFIEHPVNVLLLVYVFDRWAIEPGGDPIISHGFILLVLSKTIFITRALPSLKCKKRVLTTKSDLLPGVFDVVE